MWRSRDVALRFVGHGAFPRREAYRLHMHLCRLECEVDCRFPLISRYEGPDETFVHELVSAVVVYRKYSNHGRVLSQPVRAGKTTADEAIQRWTEADMLVTDHFNNARSECRRSRIVLATYS